MQKKSPCMKVADSAWRARKSRLSIGAYDYREPIVMQRMEEENNHYNLLWPFKKKILLSISWTIASVTYMPLALAFVLPRLFIGLTPL